MTQLDCKATECRYNEKKMCARAGITVEGKSAKKSEETYCGTQRIVNIMHVVSVRQEVLILPIVMV